MWLRPVWAHLSQYAGAIAPEQLLFQELQAIAWRESDTTPPRTRRRAFPATLDLSPAPDTRALSLEELVP